MPRVVHRQPSSVVLRLKRIYTDERAVHELLRALGQPTKTAPSQGDEPDPEPLPMAAGAGDWLIFATCFLAVVVLAFIGVAVDS